MLYGLIRDYLAFGFCRLSCFIILSLSYITLAFIKPGQNDILLFVWIFQFGSGTSLMLGFSKIYFWKISRMNLKAVGTDAWPTFMLSHSNENSVRNLWSWRYDFYHNHNYKFSQKILFMIFSEIKMMKEVGKKPRKSHFLIIKVASFSISNSDSVGVYSTLRIRF